MLVEKVCTKCKIAKSISDFHKKKNCRHGLQTRCKECNKNGVLDYYHANTKNSQILYKQRASKTKLTISIKVNLLKSEKGCLICFDDDFTCLDFHHLNPAEKDLCISMLVSKKNWNKVQEEINKCIVICSNCHRKYHAGRFSLLTDKP